VDDELPPLDDDPPDALSPAEDPGDEAVPPDVLPDAPVRPGRDAESPAAVAADGRSLVPAVDVDPDGPKLGGRDVPAALVLASPSLPSAAGSVVSPPGAVVPVVPLASTSVDCDASSSPSCSSTVASSASSAAREARSCSSAAAVASSASSWMTSSIQSGTPGPDEDSAYAPAATTTTSVPPPMAVGSFQPEKPGTLTCGLRRGVEEKEGAASVTAGVEDASRCEATAGCCRCAT
jgi:hypothetical protein